MNHRLLTLIFLVWQSASLSAADRYQAVVDKMKSLQAAHPNSAEIFSIGKNDAGNDILAMRMSTTPKEVDPRKIGHLVVGTHHGNESHAALFTLRFMEKVLGTFDSREIFRGNAAEIEWTFIPVLNIPGYNANQRYERGMDPNRDYPGPCISTPGGRLKSINTLMQFMATRVFSGSLTVHGYIGTLTYPWGVDATEVKSHDHNEFDQITRKAAEINGYRYGTSTDIVYPADGTYEDYAYWRHGMWSLLLELKDGSETDLRNTVDAMAMYFSQLQSSPSIKNQMTGQCKRNRLDLRID